MSRLFAVAALLVMWNAFAADFDNLKAKAEQGDASAQFDLAIAYDQGIGTKKDSEQAALWCLKAAEQGLASAQNCIGSMYQSGIGVTKDDAAAAGWYEKAAAQDYDEAYTNLGYMYDLGRGVKQDRTKAVELYTRGAEKGSLNAMVDLGISYEDGSGVDVDLVEAFKWLELARFYTLSSPNMRLKWTVRHSLDELQKKMSKAQIKDGKHRASEWDKAHRQK